MMSCNTKEMAVKEKKSMLIHRVRGTLSGYLVKWKSEVFSPKHTVFFLMGN